MPAGKPAHGLPWPGWPVYDLPVGLPATVLHDTGLGSGFRDYAGNMTFFYDGTVRLGALAFY